MLVSDFFLLDSIPDGVDAEQMKHITDWMLEQKRYYAANGLGDISSMTIGEVLVRQMIEDGEIQIDEDSLDTKKNQDQDG